MEISEARIQEFMQVHQREYGKPIDHNEARTALLALVILLKAVNRHLCLHPEDDIFRNYLKSEL